MAVIKAFLNHLRLRVTWVVRDPGSLAVMVFSALATLVLWPGRTWSVEGTVDPRVGWIAWLIWLHLWPALPAFAATGRGTGGFETSVSTFWLPALPIGPRARSLADAAVVILFVFVIRGPAAAAVPGGSLMRSLADTALGAVIMLPTLLSWTVPAASFNLFMLRPAAAALLVLAARSVGVLDTPFQTVTFCGLLSALILTQARHEPRLPRPRRLVHRAVDLHRPFLEPRRRVARDVWALSLQQIWPWLVAAALAVAATITLESTMRVPPTAVFIAAEALIITLMVGAVRPFGNKMIIGGLAGRFGYRFGDFVSAWSVMPLRMSRVLRHTWVYSVAMTAAAWLAGLAILSARSYLRSGSFTLQMSDGGAFAPVVIPLVAVVLTLPGFLIAAAVGHKLHTVLAGFATLLILNGHVMVLAAVGHAYPPESSAPIVIDAMLVAVLALIGGVPPLAHLRNPLPTPPATRTASG